VKPDALLRRLLDGSFTNVSFADAKRLLQALGFEELLVRGSHHIYGHGPRVMA
jgi:predicted RNA binding protein YcfA (HicA-like mRNA interferase family)